jgi:hypothetical protein
MTPYKTWLLMKLANDVKVQELEEETEECEHDDLDEHHICLNCGEDLYEDMACRAYDRAKDRWKYGE